MRQPGRPWGLIGLPGLGFSGKGGDFGSNVLAPWKANYQFSNLLKTGAAVQVLASRLAKH